MIGRYSLLVLVALSFTLVYGQLDTEIEDIRFAGRNNSYSGRVEVQYNGTWGTICDQSWSSNDGHVACRMLGFDGAECARPNAFFGRAEDEVPIWMNRLFCNGREEYLDDCQFDGWGPQYHTCQSHADDSSVVCRNESSIAPPSLTLINSTTSTIALNFARGSIPFPLRSIRRLRFRIQYNATGSTRYYFYTPRLVRSFGPFVVALSNLLRDTEYSVAIRLEISTQDCGFYSYFSMYGKYSKPISVRTKAVARPSMFQVRIIPSIRGLNFLGRVEVNYQNRGWGTVCDYRYDTTDANVICQHLNYTRAACPVYNAQTGRGRGRIAITGLVCSAAEILDDCSFSVYSSSNIAHTRTCRTSHSDDAGVICLPNTGDFLPAPRNLTISGLGSTLRFNWQRYSFPFYVTSRRFRIQYTRSDRPNIVFNRYSSSSRTTLTVSGLPVGITINATIRAQGRFTRYSCYSYLDGDASDMVSITSVEQPPSTPPRNFHISVINCTAILVEWDSPRTNDLNGNLRGYRLFYSSLADGETMLDLSPNVTEYIVGGLRSSTDYVVNVLAYTVGDGPKTIHLTATTNDIKICQTDVINLFGINGNALDRATLYSFSQSVNVLCGSRYKNADIDWFHPNGSKVGIINRHIREAHFPNGTVILQIGNERRLTACDAGTYTCRANATTEDGAIKAQQKTFRLTFSSGPPSPSRPLLRKTESTSVVLSWRRPSCDGGHFVQSYNLRYTSFGFGFFFFFVYDYVNNISASVTNYTLLGLAQRTTYSVSVQAVGVDGTISSYSPSTTFVTKAAAPTPPRFVTVTLLTPNVIFVTWTRPSSPNGVISFYTVYAIPFVTKTTPTLRGKRNAVSLQTVAKNFSGSATSGNLTLPQLGVEYHIQVSVTVLDSSTRTSTESLLSTLSSNSSLFVPVQGLPFVSSVRASDATNNSITLSWTVPNNLGETIIGYLIEYSSDIYGVTPGGTNVQYSHNGNLTARAPANSVVVQPLVSGSTYQFKVAILTARGEGKQVYASGTTLSANTDYERYVYFHVRFGPVLSCASFRRDIAGQEKIINEQIIGFLSRRCNCGFTNTHVETGFFSCGRKDHQIIYRAHILGTSSYSAIDLVNLLQSYINTNEAYVSLNNFRMILDPTCPARLDTIDDPECPTVDVTTNKPTDKPQNPTTSSNDGKVGTQAAVQSGGLTGSSLVVLFIGLIIAFLLLILIVLIIAIVFWKFNKQQQQSAKSSIPTSKGFTNQGSTMRFSELDNTNDSHYEEEKTEDKIIYSDTDKFEDNFN